MKRSEFLKKLYDATNGLPVQLDEDNIVDHILTKCEELGMLPPFWPTDQSSGHTIRYEWEPEDEA
jgi:hypothetical protein